MNEILGYIYKITNKETKEYYIGQTKRLPFLRWKEHVGKIFNNDNLHLFIFEIVEVVYKTGVNWKDRNLLNIKETKHILQRSKYYRIKYCLNDVINISN